MKSQYRQVYEPTHPRATRHGKVYAHLPIASKALGKSLPAGAEVHHVDGDKANNANSNLVICQDRDYHQFLHVRARVVRAGGNPNTERLCSGCKELRPFAAFNKAKADKSLGLQGQCRECQSAYAKAYFERTKDMAVLIA